MSDPIRNWWNTQAFPHHGRSEWAVWDGRAHACLGLDEVKTRLARWHPAHPVLVGVPHAERFVPPTCVPEAERQALAAFRRQAHVGMAAFALVAGIAFLAGWYKPGPWIWAMAAILTALTAALALDYFGSLQDVRKITERARFFYWLKVSRAVRTGYLAWLGIVLAMGAAQGLLERHHSLDDILLQYGLIYESAFSGEGWRFLVGPFFHSGLSHYLNNAISLLFFGPVLWAMISARCLLLFMLGNVVAALAQRYFGAVAHDAFLGVSGGLYALCGTLIGAAWINQRLLPPGMGLLCVSIVTTSALGAGLLSANAANVAHVAGLLLGFAVSLILRARILSLGRGGPEEMAA